MAIRDLPVHERPRERLLSGGERSLSTRELLAIVLRTGTARESALGLADRLLARGGSLRGVAAMPASELLQVPGMGPAKAAQLKAALELGRRLAMEPPRERMAVRRPQDVAALLMAELRDLDREVFKVVMLDTKHRVISIDTLSIGDLHGTLVHPRELFKDAIRRSSSALILAHNHPSGDPEPSPDDIDLTARLVAGGRLLGIEVLDHIVIGDNRYVSLRERGLVDAP
ncbi:MAG: DNA repair protein RadC [Firmicutes bacterium]|nr:DNA repair protein RadC [Bacillota bacterium]